MRDGSLNGSRRRNRSLTKLKIAVFSPMPSASVRTATRVNPGDLRSWRKANFRSFISFSQQSLVTQCDHRIDRHRTPSWKISCDQRGPAQNDDDDCVNRDIVRADVVELTRYQAHHGKG